MIFFSCCILNFELVWPHTKSASNERKPENSSSLKVEKHQRDNNEPLRNKDGQGWRRLTQITNDVLERFSLKVSLF